MLLRIDKKIRLVIRRSRNTINGQSLSISPLIFDTSRSLLLIRMKYSIARKCFFRIYLLQSAKKHIGFRVFFSMFEPLLEWLPRLKLAGFWLFMSIIHHNVKEKRLTPAYN